MLRQIISVLFIFSVSINWAQKTSQDYEQELKAQSNSIQSLRDEIEATKKRIQSENRKEKSSARRVNNLSEEISLLQRLLKEIDKEEKLLIADVARIGGKITKSEIELDSLRIRYTSRLTKIYKKGQLSNLERIFSSTSWRQTIYRAKYLKIISELDQKLSLIHI